MNAVVVTDPLFWIEVEEFLDRLGEKMANKKIYLFQSGVGAHS